MVTPCRTVAAVGAPVSVTAPAMTGSMALEKVETSCSVSRHSAIMPVRSPRNTPVMPKAPAMVTTGRSSPLPAAARTPCAAPHSTATTSILPRLASAADQAEPPRADRFSISCAAAWSRPSVCVTPSMSAAACPSKAPVSTPAWLSA